MRVLPLASTFGLPQLPEEVRPEAGATKLPEVIVDGLPGREIARQIAPGITCAQEIEKRVEDGAQAVAAELPMRRSGRQKTLGTVPLGVSKVAWIGSIHAG